MEPIHEQFKDITNLIEKQFGYVDSDPFICFRNILTGDDKFTLALFYNDEVEEWRITLINTDTMEEVVLYNEAEYNRVELLTKFINYHTILFCSKEGSA